MGMRKIAAVTGLLLATVAAAQEKKAKPWEQFGGGPERRNSSDAKLPPALVLSWKKEMGCPVPGRAQFVAGGGLLFGSSP